MKCLKRTIVLFLVFTIILCLSQSVWAQEDSPAGDELIMRYELINKTVVSIKNSSAGKIAIDLTCVGKSGTEGIKSTTVLERLVNGTWNRTTINGATAVMYSSSTTILRKVQYASVIPGTYRAVVTFTVSASGRTETVTVTSDSITVK